MKRMKVIFLRDGLHGRMAEALPLYIGVYGSIISLV
jgi:hypothetical protein